MKYNPQSQNQTEESPTILDKRSLSLLMITKLQHKQ